MILSSFRIGGTIKRTFHDGIFCNLAAVIIHINQSTGKEPCRNHCISPMKILMRKY